MSSTDSTAKSVFVQITPETLERMTRMSGYGIMQQFDGSDESGFPQILLHFGQDADGSFKSFDTNPYNSTVQAWPNWRKINRLVGVVIDVDMSGSQGGNEAQQKLALISSILGLRSKEYDFADSTWVVVHTFNGSTRQTIIEWTPLNEIDVEAIPDMTSASNTPLSAAFALSNGNWRNFAAAAKAYGKKPIVICHLAVTDGKEEAAAQAMQFGAADIREYNRERDMFSSDLPVVHALHCNMLFSGPAQYIAACESYAVTGGYDFTYIHRFTPELLAEWFIKKIHTASAYEGDGADEEPGVIDFAADLEAELADADFATDGDADEDAATS
jgi:hypothetical protein